MDGCMRVGWDGVGGRGGEGEKMWVRWMVEMKMYLRGGPFVYILEYGEIN